MKASLPLSGVSLLLSWTEEVSDATKRHSVLGRLGAWTGPIGSQVVRIVSIE